MTPLHTLLQQDWTSTKGPSNDSFLMEFLLLPIISHANKQYLGAAVGSAG